MTSQSQAAVHPSPTETCVQVICDAEQWQRLQPEWDELFAASPTASPPLRFEWLWHWWRIYGPVYGSGLRIVTIRRQSRLIGALPLYESMESGLGLRIRRVGFLSTGEAEFEETCADYLDLLHLPGERDICLDALRSALFDEQVMDWDELDLLDICDRSPLVDLYSNHRGCHATLVSSGSCPIANISGGLDAYLARLSANTRQQARRRLRIAQRAGAVLDRALDAAEAERYFDDLVRLHQQRWTSIGQPGVFASPRFAEFHRVLIRQWVPTGKAVLVRLSQDQQPLAVIYGFLVGTKFDFYQSGVAIDEPAGLQSPGTVAFLMLMAHLAERGITQFDFLRGASMYKQRLATEHCPLMRLSLARPGLRTRFLKMSNLVRRAAAKSCRLFRAVVLPAASLGLIHL